MSESLYRLIYLSHNEIDGEAEQVHQEVANILKVARETNAANGITGALMFNSGCFAQVLEGSQASVEDTFERIQCDPRHSDVVVLSFDAVEVREFDSWSMAYVGADTNSLAEFDDIRAESGFDSAKIPANRVFSIIQEHLLDAEGGDAATRAAA